MMKRFNVYFKHPVTDVCIVLESVPVDSFVNLNECEEVTLGGNKFLKVANLVIPADRILWIEIIPYDDENECDLVIKKKVNEFALEEEF